MFPALIFESSWLPIVRIRKSTAVFTPFLSLGILFLSCKSRDICIKYNFKGVFLSKDLDCDAAVLNMLMIQGAINQARKTEDIFGQDIDLLRDAQIFNQQIDSDWEAALEFFEPALKFLYDVGKEEKKANTSPSTWDGIVSDD